MSNYDIEKLVAGRFCPIHQKEIGSELCCETVQVIDRILKRSAVPELDGIDMENAKSLCDKCEYLSTWIEEI